MRRLVSRHEKAGVTRCERHEKAEVTRRHEKADVTRRHEKAGVTHLLGFFTEDKASREICAEVLYYSAPKHLILVLFGSREASRDIFAEGLKILCSEIFDFSLVLFARRSRRYEKYSAPKHSILTAISYLGLRVSRIL